MLSHFWEVMKVVVIALLIVIPIRIFLFQPFIVRGSSMEPSFHESDYLIVDQLSYRFRDPERGEVVVFQYPHDPFKRHIKRIIGLPGEELVVQEEKILITIDGEETVLSEDYLPRPIPMGREEVSLGEGEYFVMGDNRGASFDSRNWGPLPEENIVGKVLIRISPFSAFAFVEAPDY